MYLSEIYSLPKKFGYFLIGLICAILSIFIYWQDILPLRLDLGLAKQREQQLTRQLQTLYYQEMSWEEKMGQLPKTKMLLNEWQKKFIKQNDMNKLLKEIVAIGRRDQLQITLLDAEAVIDENNYMKQPFKMNVVGNYVQTAQFVEDIANLPWTVVVGDFSLAKLLAEENYSTDLAFYIYYLRK